MAENLPIGEKVGFTVGGEPSTGFIKGKITHDTNIEGQEVRAKEDNPKLLIEQDNSGKTVIRNPHKVTDLGKEEELSGQSGMS